MDATNIAVQSKQKKSSVKAVNRSLLAKVVDISTMATIFVWVGGAIVGNLIAAPAKFHALSLTLPIALDVGRMQFLWIGVFETLCVLAIIFQLLVANRRPRLALLAGIGLFAIQRLWLMPLLDERTLAIMAGQPVEESSLHLIYVAVEILKTACLIWAGILAMSVLTGKASEESNH